MCNLYSLTKGQVAIRELTRAMHDRTGNLPPMPGIFPDYGAPIVRESAEGRELVLARWGMPAPQFALKDKKTDPGVTNIRNTKSPHWRRWLDPDGLEAEGMNAKALNIARLWVLTGCRRNEIAGLKWTEIDFAESALTLDDSKTGKSRRPLGDALSRC